MGHKRDDRFTAEIMLLKEGVHRHGQLCVPVRIAYKYGVIGIQIFCSVFKLRPCIVAQLVICKIKQLVMGAGILLNRFNLKELSARFFLNKLRDILGVGSTLKKWTRRWNI